MLSKIYPQIPLDSEFRSMGTSVGLHLISCFSFPNKFHSSLEVPLIEDPVESAFENMPIQP